MFITIIIILKRLIKKSLKSARYNTMHIECFFFFLVPIQKIINLTTFNSLAAYVQYHWYATWNNVIYKAITLNCWIIGSSRMWTVIVSVRWKWLDNQNVIKLRVCDVGNSSINGLCTVYDHKPNIDVINFSDYAYY